MEYTPRVRQILLVLLKQQEPISVKNLAEQITVSKRTVQRELDYINYLLKKRKLELGSKTGTGIWIQGDETSRRALLSELEGRDILDLADKETRRNRLILELLKDQEPKKLYYYSNLFGVSEATISKDMEKIEPWFHRFQLTLVRKPGYGVTLEGSEMDFRAAIREFIAGNMNTPAVDRIYDNRYETAHDEVSAEKIKDAYQLLNLDILRRVCRSFDSIRDDRIRNMTQESYTSLIMHAAIAVERVKMGEIIDDKLKLADRISYGDSDYELARTLVSTLEDEFEIEIPDVEYLYVCLHIKGAKMQKSGWNDMEDMTPETQQELEELVHGMIVAYDESMAEILEADTEFVQGLLTHIRPTLVRMRNHLPIENPHLDEIREEYPLIYEKCENIRRYLRAMTGYEYPDTEIGFLAIHFGAAIVRLENERNKKRVVEVGLVCASGIGISRLMASRVQKYFGNRVHINTYGREDLTPYVLGRNDFFVSSMHIQEMEGEVLNVSPLLPESDMKRLEERVAAYETQPGKRRENNDFEMQLEKINRLSSRIREILREFHLIEVDRYLNFRGFLGETLQQITLSEGSRRMIAEALTKREEIATQVIPELGIALFHARTEGVQKVGVYACRPTGGTIFENVYFQKISCALILLVPRDEDQEENSRIVGYISESLVEDEDFLDVIRSGSEELVRDSLSKVLKRYFNRYLDQF